MCFHLIFRVSSVCVIAGRFALDAAGIFVAEEWELSNHKDHGQGCASRLRRGRESVFNAIVEPSRESALIRRDRNGRPQILVDCFRQDLVPRDPKQIVSEVE